MQQDINLKPLEVFKFFYELSSIPHGSGNMDGISEYCVAFAKQRGLEFYRDNANNVIIYKSASKGRENTNPIILQGHLDMVCQKNADRVIDFEKDGIEVVVDGDYLRANGTTLGADNAIAVAIILALLDSDTASHPPIEAVFTTDEEIGMIGANALDMSRLSAKRMINLDSEEEDTVTVSCAGGIDFKAFIPITKSKTEGYKTVISLEGLTGGHSGVEIDKGRVNAHILAGRFLELLRKECDFDLADITGGDKSNAIPKYCIITLCSADSLLAKNAETILKNIKNDISKQEAEFKYTVECFSAGHLEVIGKEDLRSLIFALCLTPDGVINMSANIEGLVETSLNLGILKTEKDSVVFGHALRSSKASALDRLVERLYSFWSQTNANYHTSGYYPPWEYKEESSLRQLYCKVYKELCNTQPKVEAIHAGLECAVFASKLKELDCISIGPDLFDVHTPNERLKISSVEKIYNILLELLKRCD